MSGVEPVAVLNLRTLTATVEYSNDGKPRLILDDGDTRIELRGGGPEAAEGSNELSDGAGQMWTAVGQQIRAEAEKAVR